MCCYLIFLFLGQRFYSSSIQTNNMLGYNAFWLFFQIIFSFVLRVEHKILIIVNVFAPVMIESQEVDVRRCVVLHNQKNKVKWNTDLTLYAASFYDIYLFTFSVFFCVHLALLSVCLFHYFDSMKCFSIMAMILCMWHEQRIFVFLFHVT